MGEKFRIFKNLLGAEKKFCITICITVALEIGSGAINANPALIVSILPSEILYIESNDREVSIYATENRTYRNKTGISQWENILGDNFIRIHRSYIVNRASIKSIDKDFICISEIELPISRKYYKAVQAESTQLL